jgi:hypothetical protein
VDGVGGVARRRLLNLCQEHFVVARQRLCGRCEVENAASSRTFFDNRAMLCEDTAQKGCAYNSMMKIGYARVSREDQNWRAGLDQALAALKGGGVLVMALMRSLSV